MRAVFARSGVEAGVTGARRFCARRGESRSCETSGHDADIGKIAVFLRIVHAIADDEFVGDGEADVIGGDVFEAAGWLVKKNADFEVAGLEGEPNVSAFVWTERDDMAARMMALVVITALALISMMFLLMVRVTDPLIPRAVFGMLNTVLFFPSGAVYPTQAFPAWMRVITTVDPFTYAVHGFKSLLLKETGLAAVVPDMIYLSIFAVVTLALAVPLFKRTL